MKRKENGLAGGRPHGACGPSEESGGIRMCFQAVRQHGGIFNCKTPLSLKLGASQIPSSLQQLPLLLVGTITTFYR